MYNTHDLIKCASRKCAICEEYEFDSDVGKDEFWICEKCIRKLKRIMDNALWAEDYFNE